MRLLRLPTAAVDLGQCMWCLLLWTRRKQSMSLKQGLKFCCQPGSFLFLCILVGTILFFGLLEDFLTPKQPPTPSPVSTHPLYPSRVPLLDLPHFTYLINNDVCGSEDVFATVIVHTHPANIQERNTMRKAIPQEDLNEMKLRRLFLMAQADSSSQKLYHATPQHTIEEENERNHDIIQGNFMEHYHNLTYKHTMGLQWVIRYCSQSKYIIKMDDDIVVNLYEFSDRLRYRYKERKNLILGLMQMEAKPVRSKQSKWYVGYDEFPGYFYASFMSGWAYAMTIDAAIKIVDESFKIPYFWIDDVHITGTLAERTGVKREGLNGLYTLHVDHLYCCLELPDADDYRCDYMVGPAEGDMDIMRRVLQHARTCYMTYCQKRKPEESVAKTCIRAKVPPLAPLGKGQGEIVKMF